MNNKTPVETLKEPSSDHVSEQAREFFRSALRSGSYAVFIAYVEGEQLVFSEHRTGLPVADLMTFQDKINHTIDQATIQGR